MSKPTMPIANRPNLTHREKRQFELLAQQPELDRAYYDADKNYVIEFSAADDQKNRYAVIEDYFRQSGFSGVRHST